MAKAENEPSGHARVLFVSEQGHPHPELIEALKVGGFLVEAVETASEALKRLSDEAPDAVAILGQALGRGFTSVRDAGHSLGIAVVEVAEPGQSATQLAARNGRADGWHFLSSPPEDLPLRVSLAIERRRLGVKPAPAVPRFSPFDSHFLSLIVHDLRTPLNVVGLSLRMLDESLASSDSEVQEDLRFLKENFLQIEKMLQELSDYCRMIDSSTSLGPYAFDPRRMVEELIEGRSSRTGGAASVRVEVRPDCPAEVSLDQPKVLLALEHALNNAAVAAGERPVRLILGGGEGRFRVEVEVDRPPPDSVHATELKPDRFERLAGIAAERRGLDLAIAARVSELFGGGARLEVERGKATRVVLDWPARISQG